METPKMQFVFTGFSQVMGFRVFAFEGIAQDRTRSLFTVKADLALARRYGIRLQELPLLCREVLNRCPDGPDARAFSYTEQEMQRFADGAAARADAAKKRKPPRRPVSYDTGTPWRGPQQ